MAVDIGRSGAEDSRTVGRLEAVTSSHVNGVLHRIARLAVSAPRRMLAVAALVAVAAGVFGAGLASAKSLCACGFEDPSSESARRRKEVLDGQVRARATCNW